MASLHNRNGVFYATFSDSSRKPRQRRHSLKTRQRRTAERLLARLQDAHDLGEWDPWTQPTDDVLDANRVEAPKRLDEAIALYMNYAREHFSPTTIRTRAALMDRFLDHVGAKVYTERVTARHVETFVQSNGAAASTQNARLVSLKSFGTFCLKSGWIKESVAHSVAAPKTPASLPRAVTDEELDAVLKGIPEGRAWTRSVFLFASLTGLRVGELARLRWSDIDTERRLLRIETQKNGKAQTQPMPRAALEVLASVPRRSVYVFTSPLERKETRSVEVFTNLLAEAFRLGRERAGVERKITPHGLRHRYCTKIAESGANAFTIAAAARHADVKTSQRYVSISNQHLRSELDAVFG